VTFASRCSSQLRGAGQQLPLGVEPALGQGVLLQRVEPGVDDVPQSPPRGVGRGQPLTQPAVDCLQAVQRRFRLGDLHLRGGEAQPAGPVGQPAGEEGLAAAVVPADGLEHGPPAPDGQQFLLQGWPEAFQTYGEGVEAAVRDGAATQSIDDLLTSPGADGHGRPSARRSN
jgi:hypothetical protein